MKPKLAPPPVEQNPESPPLAPGLACGVLKRPDGLWVARIIEVTDDGKARVVKESAPDLRAVALERLHVYTAQTFLV